MIRFSKHAQVAISARDIVSIGSERRSARRIGSNPIRAVSIASDL
jgi:hypothetical protein